ncbi:DUF397 domain-containing protein [Actinoallomurus sp. NPDC052308]
MNVGDHWRISTYSAQGESHCVEVRIRWRKAIYSGTGESNCVEVAVRGS